MRACIIIVVSKIYMVQLLKQIVSFILRCLTVNHWGLPHYIKKRLPYSNNLHILLPVFGHWMETEAQANTAFWCEHDLCRIWSTSLWVVTRSSPDRIRKVIFGNQHYEQDVQMLCSDAISYPICLPSISVIFSQ